MKTDILKKKLVTKLIFSCVLIIICAAICFFVYTKRESVVEKYNRLNSDISSLKSKLDGLNKRTLEFSEAVKTWEDMPEFKKNLQGISLSKGKTFLDNLEKKYNLLNLNVTFSKPETSENFKFNETLSLFVSNVELKFATITDSHLYAFLDELENNFPGFIVIKSLKFSKSKNLDKEILLAISEGDGGAMVDVNLNFEWYDVLYKAESVEDPSL